MTTPPVLGKVYMASQLTDAFARKFYYLRLSITDVCNFRCTYCLPDGYKPGAVTNKGFLSVDEVRRVTRAFSALGTEKVRLTGGEPSLRRDFTEIIAAVRENSAIRQIAVTTNGYRLARDVERWRDAGLDQGLRHRVGKYYRATAGCAHSPVQLHSSFKEIVYVTTDPH
ncbi:GTP 3',8-cyclase [Klebsiella aerogenes]|nr:GTP 3',8-cyclase [Klebsiella aerogenes]